VPKKLIAAERLAELYGKLSDLPRRSPERRRMVHETAEFYGVSETSLYRALRLYRRPKALRRSDHGEPRVLTPDQMDRYCEIIAAMKVRTRKPSQGASVVPRPESNPAPIRNLVLCR